MTPYELQCSPGGLGNEVPNCLDVAPLIDHYTDCLTHVVDTDRFLELSHHTGPAILSSARRSGKRNHAYQRSLVGLRAFRCLVTILGVSRLWESYMEDHRYIPKTCINWNDYTSSSECASVYPQVFILLTDRNTSVVDNIVSHIIVGGYFPFVVTLLHHSSHNSSTVFAKNQCVNIRNHGDAWCIGWVKMSCADVRVFLNVSKKHYDEIGRKISRSFWSYGIENTIFWSLSDADPFGRDKSSSLDLAVINLLVDERNRSVIFRGTRPVVSKNSRFPSVSPTNFVPTGTTTGYKFVTTAGVYLPRTSYNIYFTPFGPMVWYCLLLSAFLSFILLELSYEAQNIEQKESSRFWSALEMFFWILSSIFGQYKNSDIPSAGKILKGFSSPGMVVVFWLITFTFLVNVYSAIFNSVATRPYSYLTNYTKFFDLPPMQIYAIMNETLAMDLPLAKESCVLNLQKFSDICKLNRNSATPCRILAKIFEIYALLDNGLYISDFVPGNLRGNRTAMEVMRVSVLQHVESTVSNLFVVLENPRCILHAVNKPNSPVAFLVHEDEAQRQWSLFASLMDSNPKLKLANNFAAEESFLNQPSLYSFTGGLHRWAQKL